MKKRRTDKPYKSTNPAGKLLAALKTVGGMMETLSQQRSSMPSGAWVEKPGKYSVAGHFNRLGKLHVCFFNCLEAVGRANVFDVGVYAEIQRCIDRFWTVLAQYLGDNDMATEFHLTVEWLLDLAKTRNLAYKEGAEEQNRLRDKALDVFERVCKQAKKSELSLRFPPRTCSGVADTSPVLKKLDEALDKLDEVRNDAHDISATVNCMNNRHKRDVAARKASNADDAMERLKNLHPRHYRQVVEVVEILIGKDEKGMPRTCLSQRRNYSAAAKRLFRKYRKATKAPPVGGYKSAGSLYSFIHVNKADFFKLLEARAAGNGVELPKA